VTAAGAVGYRCPAEPEALYLRKGGDAGDSRARACLCNALTADVGVGQTRRDGFVEPPLVTLGDDLAGVRDLARRHPEGWTASEALAWLTAPIVV
ncbi:MAG: nitronate monooxygenase, partial [Actinomycetes bacterium]